MTAKLTPCETNLDFAEMIKVSHSDLDLVWKQNNDIRVMLCQTNIALFWTGLLSTSVIHH